MEIWKGYERLTYFKTCPSYIEIDINQLNKEKKKMILKLQNYY
jgi:hypothetical protein